MGIWYICIGGHFILSVWRYSWVR